MDIQLFTNDEELREFPENKTDSEDNTVPDMTPSPNNISLTASDLPRSHTDLPKSPSSLPISKAKCRCRTQGGHRCKSNSKNPILNCSVIQVNDCLAPIQEKESIIQMIDAAYLGQSFSCSLSQPMVAPPVVGQLGVDQSSADQPSCPIPPLLSLWLQPDLNVLAPTLSPEALWHIHLGIQIGRTLSNSIIMASTHNGSVVDEINLGEDGQSPPRGAGRDSRG